MADFGNDDVILKDNDFQVVHLSSGVNDDLEQGANLQDETEVSEVVVLSDVAEETVVTTSKNVAPLIQDDAVVQHVAPNILYTEVSQSETSDNVSEESLQPTVTSEIVWNDVVKGFQIDGCEIDIIKIQPETFVAVNPRDSQDDKFEESACQLVNPEISMREISKREKDKQKKREQRADPSYRAKEKEKNRKRMKEKRNDPLYREEERQRDRSRRRFSRQTNEELRNQERDRDREYRRYLRETDKEYNHQKLLGDQETDESNIMTDPIMEINLI